jgi:hypothetical protein
MRSQPVSVALALLALPALSGLAHAAEPYEVWLEPPSWMEAQGVGKRNVEDAKRRLPENRQKWNSLASHNVVYTLRQYTTGINVTECDLCPSG